MPYVDQFSDPAFGVLYNQISRMPALEAFVKSASIESKDAAELPSTAFAWPDERKYPVHTPEHTALSYAYAKGASEVPGFVLSAITRALEVYGVPESTFDEIKTASAPETVYLLPREQKFPVRNAGEVKYAQQQLLESMSKLDLEHRAVACATLVKVADEHKVELDPEILKLAGLVVSNLATTKRWLEGRVAATPEDKPLLKVAFQSLADGLTRQLAESTDRAGLIKLAQVITDLDEKAGLERFYDRRLPDPLRTVFNTEKLAAGSVDLGGKMVSLSKLATLPASFWQDLGGAELSNEIAPGGVVDVAKMATVVETLPLDLKIILKAQCGR